ncbi:MULTISPECIES: nitrilase-related carbon-nitrogen hydrolase [unclassified Amycolatopsis]|uniref:nitrilase-related carbon-nitrogen hydrolase n=1 Tax=unclassified Amycolatopsis TaxID=2618356 RepID=UPI00106EF0A2|nr:MULTISPECIES: nitrilase-related carbon-nitrogen hydrolase [unclassified Amycolatopsis]
MTRIVCAQLAPQVGRLAENHRQIVRTISENTTADILVLPELATSGYVFESPAEARECAIPSDDPMIAEWAAAIDGDSVVVCGYAERGPDGALYNSAVLFDATGVLARYRKTHLWDREKLFFTPGSQPPPVTTTRFGRIAVMICYDLEFPEYTRRSALEGADVIAVPTNWPEVPRPEGERPPEVVIAQAAARVNRVAIACCDRSGLERGQRWTEGTAIVDHDGWVAAVAGEDGRACWETELSAGRDKNISTRNHLFGDRRTDLYGPPH